MNKKDELISCWVESPAKFYKELETIRDVDNDEVVEAILLIAKEIRSQGSKDLVLEAIQNVSVTAHSPVLMFFFYLHWFAFDAIYWRVEEAKIVLTKMKACASILDSPYLTAECLLREAGTHEGLKSEELFLNGLLLLKEGTGQYISNVSAMLDEFAQKGALKSLDKKYINAISPELAKYFLFIDAVELGEISEALKYEEFVANTDGVKMPASLKGKIKNSIRLLNLYLEKDDREESELWALSTKALLGKNPVLALEYAKKFETSNVVRSSYTTFSSFSLLRAELSNKNVLAAKSLLDKYAHRNWTYHFIDFFYARLELMNDNYEKALVHFNKVLETCAQFDATGRLDLELELACELKSKQIRFLMEGAFKQAKDISAQSVEIKRYNDFEKNEIGVGRLKGKSIAIGSVIESVVKYSKLDIPVLILGETGVGKDVIARAIHEESDRKKEPFIAINCSAITESLLQSELFGHEAGAYTGAKNAHKGIFQEAGKGTVFLDEIGDISKGMQAALLRVLESFEYRPVGSAKPRKLHCRIITATNALLENLVDSGLFRKDLLYRLKRMVIKVPPLRERPLDVKYLADYFLNLNKRFDEKSVMSKGLEDALQNYSWPGNVRELKNEIEKMRLLQSEKTYYGIEDASFLAAETSVLSNEFNEKSGTNVVAQAPQVLEKNISPETPEQKIEEGVFKNSGSYFRRINLMKELFVKHKCITRKELCQIIGASNITIGNDIKKLIAEGFVKKIEPTKSPRTHYFELM